MSKSKSNDGNFFEDFRLNQVFIHAVPRTVTVGDASVYLSLFGSRFPLSCALPMAKALGYEKQPLDELLVFHIVFGKTVPDISFNAVANLGYADVRFLQPVYAQDTLEVHSKVVGLKENSSGDTGVVYVQTTAFNQDGHKVLQFYRWVMVEKRSKNTVTFFNHVPEFADSVAVPDIAVPPFLTASDYPVHFTRSTLTASDYEIGEKIAHLEGYTIEEAEHQMATRLYQNTARVHFNAHAQDKSRFGKRLIYGGHIISLVRSLSFNGLANAFQIVAINAGRHVAPTFAGDTIYAWSEIIDKASIDNDTLTAVRIRTVGLKNNQGQNYPFKDENGKYHQDVVLDLDYWVLMPV